MSAIMFAPQSFFAVFRLALVLVAVIFNVALAGNPLAHDQEAITDTQQHIKACVFGSPKKYDQWTIHYHEVKPSSQFPSQFILDPAWVTRHQTVGDTDVSAALIHNFQRKNHLMRPAFHLGHHLGAMGRE